MEYLEIILATAGSIVFLLLVFVPMERVFPAKKGQKIFRPHWFLDLCFFLGQYIIWGALVLWVLSYFNFWLKTIVPLEFRAMIQSQPWWLQAAEVLILSDFLIYWAHRLQHNVPFLWRFHKVHHSAQHLDWLAAHREHPLDSVYTIGIINLPAFIVGFPIETIAGIAAFRGIWAIYIHSNVRLPIKPIRWLIGAPELHHWHHNLNRTTGNYANLSPIMDILFGTYVCPDEEPEAFGIEEESPKTYVGQMLEPVLPKSVWEKVRSKKQK